MIWGGKTIFANCGSRLAHSVFHFPVPSSPSFFSSFFSFLLVACLLRVHVAFASALLSASFGNIEHASAAKRSESTTSASEAWSYKQELQVQEFLEVA